MKYAYVVIQEETIATPTKLDFQHHVLGVRGNREEALNHFDSCVEAAKKRGFNVVRIEFSKYQKGERHITEEREAIAYMQNENIYLEFKVERYKLN